MNFKCRVKSFILTILLKIYFPKIVFKVMEKPEELEKMYKLLWEVYGIEKKYFNPNNFSPESLKDEYETSSIKIGAFNGEELIGMVRIILPSSKGLYVEKDFNVDLSHFPCGEIAEISRLVVAKKYRNELIAFGLLKKAFEISRKKKINYWIVVTPEEIKNHFSKSFGVKIHPLKAGELTEKQLKMREKMSNYYKIYNPKPYWVSLKEMY